MVIPPYRLSWVTFHTFCNTWATWMRRFGGADLQGLVATGRWRDPRSAARYAHVVAHEEWDRANRLPLVGKSVELPVSKPKHNQINHEVALPQELAATFFAPPNPVLGWVWHLRLW
jgi:hypothetical protein